MFKNRSSMLVLCLAFPLLVPSQAEAGLFGFLRGKGRYCKPVCKPVCPPCRPACPVQKPPQEPGYYPCPVYAMAIGTDKEGYTQYGYGYHSDEHCPTARDCAIQKAIDDLPAGCSHNETVLSCDPMTCNCCETPTMRRIACQYKVTFYVRCCNGTLVKHSVTHHDFTAAKNFARYIACHKAKEKCNKQIRACWWTCCRVSGGAR